MGRCRLCLELRDLHDSHLIAKGFYKLVRDKSDRHPVLITRRLQVSTSKQVKAHLFCGECEDRFNKGGESWVLANCWRSDTQFPLRDALLGTKPLARVDGGAVFSGGNTPGVDPDKLAYFAVSVFWRAGLTGWPPLLGQPMVPLGLGTYGEKLRLFLLSRAGFPANAVLIIYISAAIDPMPHRLNMSYPRFYSRDDGGRRYRFPVLGITFDLLLGRTLTEDSRHLCSVRSPMRNVYCLAAMDEKNLEGALKLISKGQASRRLLKAGSTAE